MTIKQDIDKVKKEVNDTSFAFEILQDYKKANKRLFIIVLILIFSLVGSVGYTFYLLNQYQEVSSEESVEVNDINSIENSNVGINNGERPN